MTERQGSRLPRVLEAPELDRLRGPLARRPHFAAAVVFLAETGLRSAEFLSITRELAASWPQPPWWCRSRSCGRHAVAERVIGKGAGGMDNELGGKERVVVLSPRALRAARTMLQLDRLPTLWGWSDRQLRAEFQRVSAEAGVRLHAHALRHLWVQSLVDAGVPLELVADLAGHENTRTTRAYYLLSARGKIAAQRRRGRAIRFRRARTL